MKSMQGTWTLIAPDGRQWQACSPLQCCSAENRERIPPEVALARIMAAIDEPDFAERHLQLAKFYGGANTDDLIDKMEKHVARLQEKLCKHEKPFDFLPGHHRQG